MFNNRLLGPVLSWTKGNIMTSLTRARMKILRGLVLLFIHLKLETKRRWSISAKAALLSPTRYSLFRCQKRPCSQTGPDMVHFPSGSLKQPLEVMMLRQRLKEWREKFLTL